MVLPVCMECAARGNGRQDQIAPAEDHFLRHSTRAGAWYRTRPDAHQKGCGECS
jgi:hypothetical protein